MNVAKQRSQSLMSRRWDDVKGLAVTISVCMLGAFIGLCFAAAPMLWAAIAIGLTSTVVMVIQIMRIDLMIQTYDASMQDSDYIDF
jgi:cyanate permease